MIAPLTCDSRFAGLMILPHSYAWQTRSTCDRSLFAVDRDLDAGGHERALVRAAREAHADVRLLRLRPGGPVEPAGGLLQDVAESAGLEVGEAKLQRVAAGGVGQLVHEALAAERVRRRRQGPVRTVPQRGLDATNRPWLLPVR